MKRILIALPTLLVISLAVFGLSKCAPGDPVENVFPEDFNRSNDPSAISENYRRRAAQLGLDKPVFYFSLNIAAFPDTLWKIYPLERRNRLKDLTAQNGNWTVNLAFESAVHQSFKILETLSDSLPSKPYLRLALFELSVQSRLDKLPMLAADVAKIWRTASGQSPAQDADMDNLQQATKTACSKINSAKLFLPDFNWYGTNNQYHYWLSGFLSGNWGLTKNKLPVWQELKSALFATMSINGVALFFAYLISIPLGVEMARRKGRRFDSWTLRALTFLHAMPVFWLGTLLAMLLCSAWIGKPIIQNPYMDISDAWNMNLEPFLEWFSRKLPKFVLPILVLTLYSLTILSLQMRGGMLGILGLDYIRTARAKGVSEDEVYWTHAFRNAVFPLITIFASVFPALFTGSLVIETMFNFPGMGQIVQVAFSRHDIAILLAVLMSAAVLTILGTLIADLLYAWVDPRVRY